MARPELKTWKIKLEFDWVALDLFNEEQVKQMAIEAAPYGTANVSATVKENGKIG